MVESVIDTKAVAPIAEGTTALLRLYKVGSGIGKLFFYEYTLTADNSGSLHPTSPIYLQKGEYSLYSVTQNQTTPVNITSIDDYNIYLHNNQPYYRATAESVTVDDNLNIHLNFKHLTSKIRFELLTQEEGSTTTLNWLKVDFPHDQLNSFNLIDALYTGSSLISRCKVIEESDGLWELIIRPCKTKIEIELSLDISIQNQPILSNIICRGSVEIEAEAGSLYLIKVTPVVNLLPTIAIEVEEWGVIEESIHFSKQKQ